MNAIDNNRADRIRALNDALRITGTGGKLMQSAGIAALAPEVWHQVIEAVRNFDAFCAHNDPYGEHDCASLVVDGHRIIWKIDYFDQQLLAHSADPADAAATQRVLTIMLSEEY